MHTRVSRRLLLTGAVTIVAVLSGVVLSPLLLTHAVGDPGDWSRASAVGETYGAAAALLSALALCGVAASLALQFGQLKQAQFASHRERNLEILRMAIDDERLLPVLGGDSPPELHVQEIYANLVFGHMSLSWDQGIQTEASVRKNVAMLFENPVVVKWWSDRKDVWSEVHSRRRSRFLRAVALEHEVALDRLRRVEAEKKVAGEL